MEAKISKRELIGRFSLFIPAVLSAPALAQTAVDETKKALGILAAKVDQVAGLAGFNGKPGLYQAGKAPGLAMGSVDPGCLGELILPKVIVAQTPLGKSGEVTNLNSIVLTPGKWLVFGYVGWTGTSITGGTFTQIGLSTAPNSLKAEDNQEGTATYGFTFVGGVYGGRGQVSRHLDITTPTTLWLVARMNFASQSNGVWLDGNGVSMKAIRVG